MVTVTQYAVHKHICASSTSTHIPTLLDLILLYPVIENIASFLPLKSIQNLAQTSSHYYEAMHGSPVVESDYPKMTPYIVCFETDLWRRLKSLSTDSCSETGHTRGQNPKPCRLCALLVCEACVVKHSFGKTENTFGSRRRNLCRKCWLVRHPQARRLQHDSASPPTVDYHAIGLCQCTAKQGILCRKCKEEQNSDLTRKLKQCDGCGLEKDAREMFRQICLWCTRVLPESFGRGSFSQSEEVRSIPYAAFSWNVPLSWDLLSSDLQPIPTGSISAHLGRGTPLEDQRVPLQRPTLLQSLDSSVDQTSEAR